MSRMFYLEVREPELETLSISSIHYDVIDTYFLASETIHYCITEDELNDRILDMETDLAELREQPDINAEQIQLIQEVLDELRSISTKYPKMDIKLSL